MFCFLILYLVVLCTHISGPKGRPSRDYSLGSDAQGEFPCSKCPLAFKTQEFLDSHVKKKHPKGGKFEVK